MSQIDEFRRKLKMNREPLDRKKIISDLIHSNPKYSTFNDEIAIIRQRDTKPQEFEEYYCFCEECKVKADEIIQKAVK